MPPSPTPLPKINTPHPSTFFSSLNSRLNINAALAGDEEHLLNSIWILLMLVEAFIIVAVTIRTVWRSIRYRFFVRGKRVVSSRPGSRQSWGGRKVSGLSSVEEEEEEEERGWALGEKEWVLSREGEFERGGWGGYGRWEGTQGRNGGWPVTP
ncbi:hypothetical protein QBC38DRAFT_452559 [Podospora fimiseda]|uniref:Uncharacterized protein n=1 Tax=Podospora fimiseda TaxID=252190 RepID=A0AAN7BVK2_9PEZI|nr:hypothetical protein QBC38DRAFT_452559 [Podospora fimiseda]